MNSQITLTGARKIMNMAKLGTVAQSKLGHQKSANPRKYKAGGMTCYTLCVIKGAARWNSFRNNSCSFPDVAGFVAGALAPSERSSPLLIICCDLVPRVHVTCFRCGGASWLALIAFVAAIMCPPRISVICARLVTCHVSKRLMCSMWLCVPFRTGERVVLGFRGWLTACCASSQATRYRARHGKTGRFTGTCSMPPMADNMKRTASNRLSRSSGWLASGIRTTTAETRNTSLWCCPFSSRRFSGYIVETAMTDRAIMTVTPPKIRRASTPSQPGPAVDSLCWLCVAHATALPLLPQHLWKWSPQQFQLSAPLPLSLWLPRIGKSLSGYVTCSVQDVWMATAGQWLPGGGPLPPPLHFRGAGNWFKKISGISSWTRTGGGMTQLDSLTRGGNS